MRSIEKIVFDLEREMSRSSGIPIPTVICFSFLPIILLEMCIIKMNFENAFQHQKAEISRRNPSRHGYRDFANERHSVKLMFYSENT